VFVPVFVILIPGLRMITAVYRWRLRMRIYRWYGMLLALERDILGHKTQEEREVLMKRINHIEQAVNKMKMPASFGEPFYILRGHIGFVRKQLADMSWSNQT